MATEGTFVLADIGGYTRVSTKMLTETFTRLKEFCEPGGAGHERAKVDAGAGPA
jgi:hypothetical protein